MSLDICFQFAEILCESLPQAGLQIAILAYEGLDDSNVWYSGFRVFSIVVSVLSVFYGLCKVHISSPKGKQFGISFKNYFCFWEHYICCSSYPPPPNNENDSPLD